MWWWISIANKYIHQQNRMDRQAGRWEGFPSAATPRHYDGLWPNQAAWISAPSAKCELARQRFSYICMIAHVVKSAGITGQFPLSLQLRNTSFCRGALQKHILRDKCEEGGNRLKGQKYLKRITWRSGCMPKEFKWHFSLFPPDGRKDPPPSHARYDEPLLSMKVRKVQTFTQETRGSFHSGPAYNLLLSSSVSEAITGQQSTTAPQLSCLWFLIKTKRRDPSRTLFAFQATRVIVRIMDMIAVYEKWSNYCPPTPPNNKRQTQREKDKNKHPPTPAPLLLPASLPSKPCYN